MKRKRLSLNRNYLLLTITAVLLITAVIISFGRGEEELALPRASSLFELGRVRNCRITADSVPVKAGAGSSFHTIATLNRGDLVKVLAEIGDWYVVHLDNNQIGCLDSAYARPVVREDPPLEEEPEPGENREGEEPGRPVDDNPRPAEPDNALSSLEGEMISLVNDERSKNNLSPLMTDAELIRAARIKAQDMVDNDYFSHYSPTYGSPFEMMEDFDIEYLSAGENLAANSSVNSAHQSLMDSSGHRKNILSPDFNRIGVGIKSSNKYGYIFVQLFINRPE